MTIPQYKPNDPLHVRVTKDLRTTYGSDVDDVTDEGLWLAKHDYDTDRGINEHFLDFLDDWLAELGNEQYRQ